MTFETQSGYRQQRPEVGMMRQCQKIMLELEDRYGFSPVSSIKLPETKKAEKNRLTKWMNESV
jgi:phage terminase small subunit